MEIKKQYNTRAIMVALLVCSFVGLFNETALNIALSDLMRVFHISASTAQWLTTAYMLILAILMPISGLLLQRFTTRQLFTRALGSLILGTLIAALAVNFDMLMVARVFQALGMGLLLPLLFNTVLVVYPPEKRGAAMGLVGLVVMCAPSSGPTVAGILIQYLSWHYIFWISLPFIVIGMLVGVKYLENVTDVTKPRIDVLSVILSTIGFGGVVFGFSNVGENAGGWGSSVVEVSLIVGLVGLVLFVLRQIFMHDPVLNLKVFKKPMYIVGLLMILSSTLIIMSINIILPLFLQNGKELSALTTGLMLLPGSLINGILANRMGLLFDKFGPKWLVTPGFVISVVALWFFTGISPASSVGYMIVLHVALFIGVAMVWIPAQTNGLNQLPPELYPHSTAVMNTVQQASGAMSTAVAVSILTSGMHASASNAMTVGSQNVFVFALIVAVIALVISFFIRRVVVNRVAMNS